MYSERKKFSARMLCVRIGNSLASGVVCPDRNQFNMRLLGVRIGNSLACGCWVSR